MCVEQAPKHRGVLCYPLTRARRESFMPPRSPAAAWAPPRVAVLVPPAASPHRTGAYGARPSRLQGRGRSANRQSPASLLRVAIGRYAGEVYLSAGRIWLAGLRGRDRSREGAAAQRRLGRRSGGQRNLRCFLKNILRGPLERRLIFKKQKGFLAK